SDLPADEQDSDDDCYQVCQAFTIASTPSHAADNSAFPSRTSRMPKRRISRVVAGLMDRALTDQVPERITGHAVRDHRDRHRCIGGPATDAAARLLRLTPGALAGAEQGDYRSADGDPASGATNGRRWAAEDVFHCVPLSFCVLVRNGCGRMENPPLADGQPRCFRGAGVV